MEDHGLSIRICRSPEEMKAAAGAEMVLIEGLGNNIIKQVGNVELGRSIKIFVRNRSEEVVGGVIGNVFGGWVYISLLWIEESLRNLGLGTELVHMLEAEAIQLGCRYAHLDTYSFEAKPFYERLDYQVFAVLEDYPQGHCKFFLKKRLAG